MTLNEKADAYYDARRAYEEAKAKSDELYHAMKRAEGGLVDFMLEEEHPNFGRTDGTTVSLRKSCTLSCTGENMDQIRDWLVETVGDDTAFVRDVVHKPALLDHVKKKIEEENMTDDEFPDFMRVSTRPTLSVRGWSKRA